MIKKLVVVLVVFCSVFMVACNDRSNKANVHDSNIESVTEIQLVQGNTVSYYVGEHFNLYTDIYKIVPNSTSVVPDITVDNGGSRLSEYTGILHLDDQSGDITCLRVGTAKITIELKLSKDIVLSKTCSVNVLDDAIYATSVKANDVALANNITGKFIVQVTPINYNQGFTFSSSNVDVVSVDNEGNYQTHSFGSSTITVGVQTANGTKSTTFDVLVMDDVKELSLHSSRSEMLINKKYTLTVSSSSNLNSDLITFNINGDTVNSKIATITPTTITATAITYEISFKALGSFSISACYDNKITDSITKSNSINVDVYNPINNVEIKLNDTVVTSSFTLTLIDYEYQQLAEGIIYSAILQTNILDDNTNGQLDISFSQDGIVSYDKDTKTIKALNAGETILKVTAGDDNQKCFEITLIVVPATVTQILSDDTPLDESPISLYMTEPASLNLSVYPLYAVDKTIHISCADDDIIQIKDNQIEPLNIGDTTLTISVGNLSYNIRVNVLELVQSVQIFDVVIFRNTEQITVQDFSTPIKVCVDDIITFGVQIKDVKGNTIPYDIKLSNTGVVEHAYDHMEHITFNVVGEGEVTITVGASFASSIKSTLQFVSALPVHINSAHFEYDTLEVNINETATVLNKLITDPPVYDDIVTFTSSKDSIASVDKDGTVNILGVGNCEISCYVNGVFMCKYTLNVINKIYATDIQSDLLNQVNILGKNKSVMLTYTVLPAEYNGQVYISVSSDTILQLDGNMITGKSTGSANVTLKVETAKNQYKEFVIKFNVIDYVSQITINADPSISVNQSVNIEFVADYTLDANNVQIYIDDTLQQSVTVLDNIARISFTPDTAKIYTIKIDYINQLGEKLSQTTTINVTAAQQDYLWLLEISGQAGEFSLNNDIVLPSDFCIQDFRASLVGNQFTISNVTTTFIKTLHQGASLSNIKFALDINKNIDSDFAYLIETNNGALNNVTITGDIIINGDSSLSTSTILNNAGEISGLTINASINSNVTSSFLFNTNTSSQPISDVNISASVSSDYKFYTVSPAVINATFNDLNINLTVNKGATVVAGISESFGANAVFTNAHINITLNATGSKTCGMFVKLSMMDMPITPFVNTTVEITYNAGDDNKSHVAMFSYSVPSFNNYDLKGVTIIYNQTNSDLAIVVNSQEEGISDNFTLQQN